MEVVVDEDAAFLWNKVNRQLPPQICAGFPTQLDTQSVAATLVFTLNVVPQKHCVLCSNPTYFAVVGQKAMHF